MKRLGALSWAAGVGTLAVTFVGAARLWEPPAAPLPPPPAGLVGTTVHGEVDSDPPPVRIGPPTATGGGTVVKVHAADGQAVRAGDPLVQFDDAAFRAKLDQARGKLLGAEALVEKAKAARAAHAGKVALQRVAIQAAEDNLASATEGLRRGKDKFERALNLDRDLTTDRLLSDAQKEKRRQDDPELFTAEANVKALGNKLEGERKTLAWMETDPVEASVRAAEGDATAARGLVAEAEAAVAACLVKAQTAGTVEQLDAAPGGSYNLTSRTPLLLLVPTGPRLVRAAVDPEFAYRIMDKAGAAVTVTDFTNTALTYPGVVRRVSRAFLPKRSGGGALVLDPPKALECLIDLPDPAPAGKPPLQPGQPVRVVFPQ